MKEEKILYFDIIIGISGDMTLSTLLNLGVPKEIFLEELSKLNLNDEFEIEINDKFENGIKGTNVNVITKENHVHRNLIDIYDKDMSPVACTSENGNIKVIEESDVQK